MAQKSAALVQDEAPACVLARPRERIIAAARDLFHRFGLRSIGVETIAEAAGSNKMTLYRHFGSKDDLILACIEDVAHEVDEMWRDLERAHPGNPLAQLQGWIHECAECVVSDGRGCTLANAAIELAEEDHPVRRRVEAFKTAHRNHVAELCRQVGIARADLLADALVLLVEGARVSRQSTGADGPSARFVPAAKAIIDAFART